MQRHLTPATARPLNVFRTLVRLPARLSRKEPTDDGEGSPRGSVTFEKMKFGGSNVLSQDHAHANAARGVEVVGGGGGRCNV